MSNITASPKITPFLWFDSNAEEAAEFYISVFKNSSISSVHRYGEGGPGPKGSAMIVKFSLDGQEFLALNGGPHFKFTEAISFSVNCEDQPEVDYLWDTLTADGGKESQCGWLKDKFGLSWQIVPKTMNQTVGGPDPVKAQRAMKAMMQMTKLDVNALQRAYDGE